MSTYLFTKQGRWTLTLCLVASFFFVIPSQGNAADTTALDAILGTTKTTNQSFPTPQATQSFPTSTATQSYIPTGGTSTSGTSDLLELEDCDPSVSGSLGQKLYQANRLVVRRMIYAPYEPGGPYDQFKPVDVEKTYCITDIFKLIDMIKNMYVPVSVSGIVHTVINVVLAQLFQVVENWLNQACAYAAVTVNNLLDKLCIPMPGLPDFDVPGIPIPDREFCNGWSLTDNPVTGNMFEIKTYPATVVPETLLGYAPGSSWGATTLSPNYMLRDVMDKGVGTPVITSP